MERGTVHPAARPDMPIAAISRPGAVPGEDAMDVEYKLFGPHSGRLHVTLEDLPDWLLIYGSCFECRHIGLLNRTYLSRKLGADRRMKPAEARLRCTVCGNRHHNVFASAKPER